MTPDMQQKNFLKSLPKKRMASGSLLFDDQNRLLIVKPKYKNHWLIPGGIIENNESPRQACIREIKEEIGLEIQKIDFLCVDYKLILKKNDESLQFIFYGGILDKEQINSIVLQPEELNEYKFLEIKNALSLLTKSLSFRVSKSLEALKNNSGIYIESEQK